MGLHRAGFALMGLLLSSWGCSVETTGPERFARQFLPYSEEWISERSMPKSPQKKPAMTIWELTRFSPGSKPTPEQRAAAEDLIDRCERAVQSNGWESFDQAVADGYRLVEGDRQHHYRSDYILDDRILDPEHPEFLMYYPTPERRRLVGFMFYVRKPLERGPQIGGPLTVWHYHIWSELVCFVEGMYALGQSATRGRCPDNLVPKYRSPEMLHVWLIDRPNGPFATKMYLDPKSVKAAIEKRDRERSIQFELAPARSS